MFFIPVALATILTAFLQKEVSDRYMQVTEGKEAQLMALRSQLDTERGQWAQARDDMQRDHEEAMIRT